MATYIPGVGSYLPEFKPFTPDYKFLSNVLDTKTTKYETNFKALNDVYSKVVYGNLSRKDTQEMRDQYAENLAPKLQQIAGSDLSMAQNVEAAKGLFRPFFEEDLIVKDLAMTKKYRNEMQYADMLKNSTVQEEREKYWQTGVQKMQYEMQDFVDAGQDQALKMGMIQYTPDSDLYQMAMNYLNESELGTDVITEISENGEWMIHRKNGDLITNEALTMVQKALKDDPMVVNAYHAAEFVKSRQYADQGIKEGRFQTIDQGQHEWATNKIAEIEAEIEKRKAALESQKKKAEEKNTAWENTQKQNGIIKGSEEEKLKNNNKSELTSLQERLKELNNLEADQPDSEKKFKTTGEYDPADTQSLLYRAYGLSMNYNMESDLQAAALTYSKKDAMVKLEANEYAVLAKRHKYDMDKLAAQHEYKKREMEIKDAYDKENIALKAQLEAEASGIDKLDGLGSDVITGEDGTVRGGYTDEDGNFEMEGDYIDNQKGGIADRQQEVNASKVNFLIKNLEKQKDQTNSGSGLLKFGNLEPMTSQQLQKLLITDGKLNDKYKAEFNKAFESLSKNIRDIDPTVEAFADGSPLYFTQGNEAAEYAALRSELDNIESTELQLNHALEQLYKTSKSNLDIAITTNFDTDYDEETQKLLEKAVMEYGAPSLFYTNENGVVDMYDEDEYLDVFAEWSKKNGNKVSIKDTKYDDTSWLKPRSNERMADSDGNWAGLGHGKSETITYETRRVSDGLGGVYQQVPVKRLGSSLGWQRDISDMQARDFYSSMKELSNLAIRGKLESVQTVTDKKGDLASVGNKFDVYDVEQALRGVDKANMTAGEIMNVPAYRVLLDPRAVTDDAAMFIKEIDKLVNQKMTEQMTFGKYAFNEASQEDSWWDDADIITQEDEPKLFNYDKAEPLLKQYIRDLTKRRSTDSKSVSDYPIAEITYYPSWTSNNKEEMNSPYAGYEIEFSEEYLDGLRKEGGLLHNIEGNKLSIIIDREQDQNPRKLGKMNYSYVASSIATSDDASFTRSIPNGGSFSIFQGVDGQYNIKTQLLQWDNEQGKFMSSVFVKAMEDDRGVPITQANRNYLDFYMNQFLYEFEKVGTSQTDLKNAWKKAHPDALVEEPEMLFANN